MAEGSVVKAGAWAMHRGLRVSTAHARPQVAQPYGEQRSTLPPYAASSSTTHFFPRQRVHD